MRQCARSAARVQAPANSDTDFSRRPQSRPPPFAYAVWVSNRPAILLVDGDPDSRSLYSELLWFAGFDVVALADGSLAVEAAVTTQAAAVVSDIRVGTTIDGVECIRRLRADARTAAIPVIVLTATVTDFIRASAKRAGCDTFLSKPCDPATLALAVRRLMGERNPRPRRADAAGSLATEPGGAA